MAQVSLTFPDGNVKSFDAGMIRAYLDRFYGANSLIVSAAGAVDHAEIARAAERLFGAMPQVDAPAFEPARYRGGEEKSRHGAEQANVVIAFESVGHRDKDACAAHVFSGAVGGGMSSRLFQEVREKRGLCYSVYAFHSTYRDAGLFGIYAATGDKELAELVPVIGGELEKIAGRVEDHELARAKAQIKAGLMMSLESSSSRAEQIARQQMVFGRVLPVAEILEAVEAVETGDISALAHDIFSGSPVTVSAIGPLRHLATYGEIAGKFS